MPVGDPIATTYPSTNGPHTVKTWHNGTWTNDEWWDAHKQNVRAAMLGDFPLVLP